MRNRRRIQRKGPLIIYANDQVKIGTSLDNFIYQNQFLLLMMTTLVRVADLLLITPSTISENCLTKKFYFCELSKYILIKCIALFSGYP